jgi:hypothetical protein
MRLPRTLLVAALAASVVLTAGAPVAGASIVPASPLPTTASFAGLPGTPVDAAPVGVGTFPTGACVNAGINGQGGVGGNTNHACVGAGLSFIGPSSSIATVVGATIITPAFVGTSIVAGGNVSIGP